MTDAAVPLEYDALIAAARQRSGLEDFGPDWIFAPFRVYLDAIAKEAELSEIGRFIQGESIIKGLVARLRRTDDIRRHPEILDEQVTVAATIVSLHRTGSTLMHRMLGSAPSLTAMHWWETQFPAPLEGEARGDPGARRAAAQTLLDQWLAAMPELLSIHPMSLDQPDEEVSLQEQMFMGLSPESFLHIPSYAAWSATADHRPVYEDLRLWLQYLQWQDRSRAGRAWVLKTPAHLTAPEQLAAVFPETVIVMTHRDPIKTIPSFASMSFTLRRMLSDRADKARTGRHWLDRLSTLMSRLMRLRPSIGEHRFVDIDYEELVKDPIAQARRVFAAMGRELGGEDEAAMRAWFGRNPRDGRPSHQYGLEEYGLTAEAIDERFADYKARFLKRRAVEAA
ncbi:sulfotransferase family protein [Rhizorhabdus wittichii]|uniref:sulfotransferase family protein n=1 Tax=Rhizorhabdus wittichii TaxID=160791 RepID=UPI0002D25A88|nr:sulfotransferase [Rhizorhabdus wittichii]